MYDGQLVKNKQWEHCIYRMSICRFDPALWHFFSLSPPPSDFFSKGERKPSHLRIISTTLKQLNQRAYPLTNIYIIYIYSRQDIANVFFGLEKGVWDNLKNSNLTYYMGHNYRNLHFFFLKWFLNKTALYCIYIVMIWAVWKDYSRNYAIKNTHK